MDAKVEVLKVKQVLAAQGIDINEVQIEGATPYSIGQSSHSSEGWSVYASDDGQSLTVKSPGGLYLRDVLEALSQAGYMTVLETDTETETVVRVTGTSQT